MKKESIKQQKEKEDEEEYEEQLNSQEESQKKLDAYSCQCGKSYNRQSSLYNHIKIKHDNLKDKYEVPRNVRPGRPKNSDIKEKPGIKVDIKKQKPKCIDGEKWNFICLLKNPIAQKMIVKYKEHYIKLGETQEKLFNQCDIEQILRSMNIIEELSDDKVSIIKDYVLRFQSMEQIIEQRKMMEFLNNLTMAYIKVNKFLPDQRIKELISDQNKNDVNELYEMMQKDADSIIQEMKKEEDPHLNQNYTNQYQQQPNQFIMQYPPYNIYREHNFQFEESNINQMQTLSGHLFPNQNFERCLFEDNDQSNNQDICNHLGEELNEG